MICMLARADRENESNLKMFPHSDLFFHYPVHTFLQNNMIMNYSKVDGIVRLLIEKEKSIDLPLVWYPLQYLSE